MNPHSSLALFLLSLGSLSTVGALDLYVREKYETADGNRCDECDADCFLWQRAFFLQGSCFNRGYGASSVYDEVEDGVVCRQDFGESCDEGDPKVDVEASCRDTWNLQECVKGEKMKKLTDWCVEADAPEAPYTVPLLAYQQYDSVDSCGTSDYVNILLPDEGGSCFPFDFWSKADEVFVKGSRRVKCNGSVLEGEMYDNPSCGGEGTKIGYDGTSDQCPAEGDGSVFTHDCGAPSIYCKASVSFSGSDGSESQKAGVGTGSGNTVNSGNGPSAARGAILVLGSLLLMSVA